MGKVKKRRRGGDQFIGKKELQRGRAGMCVQQRDTCKPQEKSGSDIMIRSICCNILVKRTREGGQRLESGFLSSGSRTHTHTH